MIQLQKQHELAFRYHFWVLGGYGYGGVWILGNW